MTKKKHNKKAASFTEYAEVKVDHGIFEDYLQYGPQIVRGILPPENRMFGQNPQKSVA